MGAKAVDFVHYAVSDLDRSIDFYGDVLGLDLEVHHEEFGWAEFAIPPTTLALDEVDAEMQLGSERGGGAVALAVDDVEAAVKELREHDVDILQEPIDTSVCDMARTTDPDGNHLVIHHRHDGTCGRRDPLP